MNTRGFMTSDQLNRPVGRSATYGQELVMDSMFKGDVMETPPEFKTEKDVDNAVKEAYERLLKDKKSSVLLFDTCVHSGDSLRPVLKGLERAGLTDIKLGVMGKDGDNSGLQFDLSIFNDPFKGCYPFHRDQMVQKTFETPHSKRNPILKERINSVQLREEIRGIMQDYLSRTPQPRLEKTLESTPNRPFSREPSEQFVLDSIALEKIRRRQRLGKPLDLLALDIDGTIGIRTRQGTYIGSNRETAQQIRDKNIPVILNTGRPEWEETQDTSISQNYALPPADAVIAGSGTLVYWRNKDGLLQIDKKYLELMRRQRISIRTDGNTVDRPYNPDLIANTLNPILSEFIQNGLQQILVDRNDGIGGVRLVAESMSYEELRRMIRRVQSKIAGIKLQISEYSSENMDQAFSGWIHIVPAAGGKDRALSYVLSELNRAGDFDEKLIAHAIGDSSLDTPMLAMGTSEKSGFEVKQYALGNHAPDARRRLQNVMTALSSSVRNQSFPRAQVRFLPQNGPDGVFHVTNSLA